MKKTVRFACILLALMLFAGCTGGETATVSVQPVSAITGFAGVGLSERFAGIVTNRGETEINADSDRTVKDILVKTGDEVKEGDILFTYDIELSELNLEKAGLELQQLQAGLDALIREKETLEKEKEKAKAEDQLSYTLEIQGRETEIREARYNIALKEKEVARLEASLEVRDCPSPVSGTVGTINENGQGYYGEKAPAFMTIIQAGTYRVKGYINENNAGALMPGTELLIRSRIDDRTWSGYVDYIDYENPDSGNSGGGIYYYEDKDGASDLTTSSRYPFYVELLDSEGLLMGQHVYIEPAGGLSDGGPVLSLPSWYFAELSEGTGSVWAANARNLLEKRTVTLGAYDEMTDSYEITEGLSENDLLAVPEEGLTEGMTCIKYDLNDLGSDEPMDVFPNETGVLK